MILTAHQPNYLPWRGWFTKAARADITILMAGDRLPTQSYDRRAWIRTPQGKTRLTASVTKPGGRTGTTYATALLTDHGWARKHRDTIKQSYARGVSEAVEFILDLHSRCFEPGRSLADANTSFIRGVLDKMVIPSRLEYTVWDASDGLSISERIARWCVDAGADEYLSGPSGARYLDLGPFARAGVKVTFHSWQEPPVPQLHGSKFMPGLSIVDALCSVGFERTRETVL
jgi:hypothetical protein